MLSPLLLWSFANDLHVVMVNKTLMSCYFTEYLSGRHICLLSEVPDNILMQIYLLMTCFRVSEAVSSHSHVDL